MSHTTLDLAAALHNRGARLTPQRQIILDALCALGGHVTVAELYERVHADFPAIDRSTVYRALAFFVELGLVAAAEMGGRPSTRSPRATGSATTTTSSAATAAACCT
jgi:Fur family ferric uptake transcriptional regulator